MFKQRQPATSKSGSLAIAVEGGQLGRNRQGSNAISWSKLVMDMYPPGTSVRYGKTCIFFLKDLIVVVLKKDLLMMLFKQLLFACNSRI